MLGAALIALIAAGPAAPAGDAAFDKRYAHDLVRKPGAHPALEWTCEPGDVWRVRGLEFVRGGELSLSLGASTVVFGVHAKNPVWAVILPDAPTSLAGRLPAASGQVTSVWVRFHPSQFPELFPAGRVEGPGPASALLAARRIAAQKMDASYKADGFPMLPDEGALVLDCETAQGVRRFFLIDDAKRSVEAIAAFEKRVLPADVALDPSEATAAFDRAWAKFDASYAKFALRPEVDWDALKARYRPLAASAQTTWEAATAIALLVGHLRDLHAWVRVGDEWCANYQRLRPQNAVWAGTKFVVGEVGATEHELAWGRTKDGIAFVGSFGLSDPACVETFDRALDELGACWALVLDLRLNGGGDETLAQKLAGRFADKQRVYSKSQYRSDPARRDALGTAIAREVEPRGPWRFAQPVVVLQGRKTISSAESFAAMMAQFPNVTTMGDRTAGSSGNPERLELAGGIVVNVPRWNDLDADGKPIEDAGIAPDVPIATTAESFGTEKDALVTAALERLRKQVKGVRRAAKPTGKK